MLSPVTGKVSKFAQNLKRSWVKHRVVAPLLASVPRDAVILEIGGSFNPRYTKPGHPNVYHLDHCSAEELCNKYAPLVGDAIKNIQAVDFIANGSPLETIIPPELRFDVIYGAHVLEHQVDLVGHLQSLAELLKPGGRVIEMIPDLRTCFDAFRYPSVTADALVAHFKGSAIHHGRQVFDALSRQLDKYHGYRMRDADLDGVGFDHSLRHALDAMRSAERPGQAYLDLHAWTFTPQSFVLLMIELRLLGLIKLAPSFVSPQYGNQFCAVLQNVDDAADGPTPDVVERLERERLALLRQLRV